MARTNTLTDMQLALLTTAAGRPDGSLLPPPASLGNQLARIRLSIRSLIERELAAEIDVTDPASAWREEGDRHIGVALTNAGRAAIGDDADAERVSDTSIAAATEDRAVTKPGTKQALIVDLLRREGGASLTELTSATGWLPHTTRAALTGLRKKGHAIARDKVSEETRYRIAAVA